MKEKSYMTTEALKPSSTETSKPETTTTPSKSEPTKSTSENSNERPSDSSPPADSSQELGRKARKILRRRLKTMGLQETDLPAGLKDQEIARSRKGKMGQIVVREFSGVTKNATSRLVKKFEKDLTEGRDDIIQKLEAVETRLPDNGREVLNLLRQKRSISLARAIAEAGADASTVLDAYAKGAMAIGKMETMVNLYKAMPSIFRDLMRHAIDKQEKCDLCLGVGKVQARAKSNKLGPPCPRCDGSGLVVTSSDHKEFAMQKALDMAQILPQKGPLVAVQQNQQNIQAGGADSGLLEKMSKAADELLYGRTTVADSHPLEGEVIDVEAKEVKDGD
jgi:hypothetical protein